MRVLIVDDDKSARDRLKVLFAQSSTWIVCGEATNGQEAVAAVQLLRPDVVVLDLSMPVMNGIQAGEEICKIAPATKSVMISQHRAPQVADAEIRAGASLYLTNVEASRNLTRKLDSLFANEPSRLHLKEPPLARTAKAH